MIGWTFSLLLIFINFALIPHICFLLVVTAAAFLARRGAKRAVTPVSRFLIVIPAHDEEPVVSKSVQSCLEVDYPRSLFDVVLIADNCSDGTAVLARLAGARVVERLDESKKSKGHAIDYLIDTLQQSGELERIDALVIVDADTTIDRRLLTTFDQDLREGCDWIQAHSAVANPDATWRTVLLTYAFSLFNGVMALGKTQLGLGASFQGNGMCLSVRGLRRVPWHCHGLVEDLEYTWVLRMAGEAVVFEPEVSVYSTMLAHGGEAAVKQRQRWEFGRKAVRRKVLVPLITCKVLSARKKILALCDLTLPTITTLTMLCIGVAVIDILCLLGSHHLAMPLLRPVLVSSLSLMALALGLHFVSPFLVMGLPWRYAAAAGAFPIYLFWKVLVLFGGRPDRWIRTPREIATGSAIQTVNVSASIKSTKALVATPGGFDCKMQRR